jgi:DNA polymerase-3 subunit chi
MSVKVSFIVLNSAIKSRIVCDLAEKCYQDGKRLVIFSATIEGGSSLDTMLWTWKQQSFIPHKYTDSLQQAHEEPVVLTSDLQSAADYSTLLLYDPAPLEKLKQFSNIIDFAEKYDEQALQASRDRYKTYRDHNFTIETVQPGEFLHS